MNKSIEYKKRTYNAELVHSILIDFPGQKWRVECDNKIKIVPIPSNCFIMNTDKPNRSDVIPTKLHHFSLLFRYNFSLTFNVSSG